MPVKCWKSGTERLRRKMRSKSKNFTSTRPDVGLVGYPDKRENELNENWKKKAVGAPGPGWIYRCVCTSPSQPLSTCPMVAKASAKRSGRRPFRSTVARQPWNPSREWTSLGRSRYISLEMPPMYRSPGKEQHNEWQLNEPITVPDCISVRAATNHFHWLV